MFFSSYFVVFVKFLNQFFICYATRVCASIPGSPEAVILTFAGTATSSVCQDLSVTMDIALVIFLNRP